MTESCWAAESKLWNRLTLGKILRLWRKWYQINCFDDNSKTYRLKFFIRSFSKINIILYYNIKFLRLSLNIFLTLDILEKFKHSYKTFLQKSQAIICQWSEAPSSPQIMNSIHMKDVTFLPEVIWSNWDWNWELD